MHFDQYFRYHKYLNSRNYIKSIGGKILLCKNGIVDIFIVDKSIFIFLARFKFLRRLLRLNRINVKELSNGSILVIYNYVLYLYQNNSLEKKFTFNFTRYVHDETISIENNLIVIGEYGNSKGKYPVGVLVSEDYGITWVKHDLHFPTIVKNILSVKFDKYSNKYWVFFGESKEQSRIEIYNLDWSLNQIVGLGDFKFRAISSFFFPNFVFWYMNNPSGDSYAMKFHRNSNSVTQGYKFPGPIWYSASNNEHYFLSTASEEKTSNEVHLLVSKDCENWKILEIFHKDQFNKKFFLYGMISFPLQNFHDNTLCIYCEALKNYDNKMHLLNINA